MICVLKVRWTQVDEAWVKSVSLPRHREYFSPLSVRMCAGTHACWRQARNIHACFTRSVTSNTLSCDRSANSWTTTQTTNKIINLYFTGIFRIILPHHHQNVCVRPILYAGLVKRKTKATAISELADVMKENTFCGYLTECWRDLHHQNVCVLYDDHRFIYLV